MTTPTKQIVDKAWNFAHVLRDDGLSYMAYTEQITFLLFLKMADEQTRPPYNKPSIVPTKLAWPRRLKEERDELEKRDKLNLDIFWLRDKSLEDSDDLPEPDVLAQEIADDLQAALEQFAGIAAELRT